MNITTALLIVDVQQGLCHGDGAAFEAPHVIDRINFVSRRARQAGVPIVVVQHESPGGLLAYGSDAWQLADGLITSPTDLRLRKTTPDSFLRTELDALLRVRGVTHLTICGLQSDFCIDTTTRRALALGYPVTLVADGHSTVDNAILTAAQITAHHNVTLAGISSFGPRAIPLPAAEIRFPAT